MAVNSLCMSPVRFCKRFDFADLPRDWSLVRIALDWSAQPTHIQRFQDGWLVGESRGGQTKLYDPQGRVRAELDLGDASEDLQTTPEGHIWVSYFDEGVFGNGIGAQGVVCFDGAGVPLFRYAEFAEQHGLPMISDCYAMNVGPGGEVWLNYYTDFPLVVPALVLHALQLNIADLGDLTPLASVSLNSRPSASHL